MNVTKRVGLVTGVVSLSLTCAGFANASGSNDQDLQARLAKMEAEVARLQAQQGDAQMTEQRAAEIRAIVQDVLADADTRASLLQGGMSGGWDDGFYLASSDGGFRLNVAGQMQVRFIYNMQDDDAALDGDSNRAGFENTRTKLIFSGNVFNQDWTYKIEGNFGRGSSESGAGFALQDAWINYDFGNNFGLRVGQFKGPFSREYLVDSSTQLAVERSVITGAFNTGRVQGIMVHWANEQFRWAASLNDGLRSANTAALVYDTEWSVGARAELLLSGNWDQFEDFTSWQDDEFGALIGGAVHYQSTEYGTAAIGEVDTLLLTVDAQLEFGGANIFAALYYSDFDSDVSSGDFNPWGAVLQGGVMLNEEWELFGRFEWGDSDIAGSDELAIVTVGVTKFWDRHNLKWTTDIGYSLDQIDAFWAGGAIFGATDADLAGYRQDNADEDGQLVLRTQLQLLF